MSTSRAWAHYLVARVRLIVALREEGLSFEAIAKEANLADGAHAERIYVARIQEKARMMSARYRYRRALPHR